MNLWAQIKVWTKVVVLSLIAVYLFMFIFENTGSGKEIAIWVWFNKTPTGPVLIWLPLAFLFGVICTLLFRTVWRTLRQLQQIRRRQMEKEAAAIVTRAAKLRVREEQSAVVTAPSTVLRNAPITESDADV